ncbi:MAG: DUF3089 domain-containing protein [Solirubrobacterales bacterium]|nr:DUF3089 domain-containing protein [Solirubrobacterales bacterium]
MRAKTATSLGAALIVAALTCLLCAGGASAKADKTKWLCKPGATPNPCVGSLETTVTSSDGATRIETAKNAKKPKIDCFYVYPTVSEQPTINANKDIDPAQTAIAEYQAARFSEDCNVYAPVYRQLTLSAISGTEPVDESARELAYGDVPGSARVPAAQVQRRPRRRPIGTRRNRDAALLREEIEKKRAQSKKLVAALLLGGNVTVEKGERTGGSFRRTPTCKREDETGCVIAFSTFGETPPADAIFGTSTGVLVDTGNKDPEDLKVVCTKPSAYGVGADGELDTLVRSDPFPGTIGLGLQILYGGPQPTAATPWLVPKDHYSGRCVRQNKANVLLISPLDGARQLNASPTPGWGLHLVDANIALGQLVENVADRARAFVSRAPGPKAN